MASRANSSTFGVAGALVAASLLSMANASDARAATASWSLSPTTHDFGAVSVSGPFAPAVFTLTNDGDVDLPPPEVQLQYQHVDGYEHEILEDGAFDCVVRAKLAAGESCTTEIFFRPVSSGQRSGTITFYDASSQVDPVSASLSGVGLSPAVSFSQPWGLRAAVGEGPSAPPSVLTVTNAGDADLSIAGISLVGENAGHFAIVGGKCQPGLVVAPAASCGIQLTFMPTAPGLLPGELQLTDNAGDGSQVEKLVGIGYIPPPSRPTRLATFISQRPRKRTPRRFATFRFVMPAEERVRFLCKLDRRRVQSCSSPITYRHLALGPHAFRVRARTVAPDVSRLFSVARFEVVPWR